MSEAGPIDAKQAREPSWWVEPIAERSRAWIERHREPLERSSDVLLGLGVLMAWTQSDVTSALVGLLWLVLRLAISPGSQTFNWALILILLLNLRGVVLHEGPKPFSHIQYIVVITAFVAGLGRPLRHWQASLVAIAVAAVIGFVFNLTPLSVSLQAIWAGQADLPGYLAQSWGGQYFRVGALSVNQTAFLCGLSLCQSAAVAIRSSGRLRILMTLAATSSAIAAFATGSRLAMLLPPLLVAAALLLTRQSPSTAARADGQPPRRGWWRPRRLALVIGAAALALVLLHQSGLDSRLLYTFFERKSSGDDGRLTVLACYLGLPFLEPGFWFFGAGYGAAMVRFCDEDVGITVSHAHNFIVQIVADSGLISAAAVTLAAVLVFGRLKRLLSASSGTGVDGPRAHLIGPALLASCLFLLIFNIFELTTLKVTMLTLLFGFLPACSFWVRSPSQRTSAPSLPALH